MDGADALRHVCQTRRWESRPLSDQAPRGGRISAVRNGSETHGDCALGTFGRDRCGVEMIEHDAPLRSGSAWGSWHFGRRSACKLVCTSWCGLRVFLGSQPTSGEWCLAGDDWGPRISRSSNIGLLSSPHLVLQRFSPSFGSVCVAQRLLTRVLAGFCRPAPRCPSRFYLAQRRSNAPRCRAVPQVRDCDSSLHLGIGPHSQHR